MDKEYLKLLDILLEKGNWIEGRNGRTLGIPFYSFTINAKDWMLSLRKMHYKGVKGEWDTLMDTKNPLTNVSQFEANGCPYWKLWAKEDGSLRLDYFDQLHPQLEDVIENIKKDPYSRRNVVNLWNHENVQSGVLSLPPCWHEMIFTVINNTLHITWINRSLDVYYGLPADVYLARLFLEHVSNETGIPFGDINFVSANVHLYENQTLAAEQLCAGLKPNYKPELKE